jgi:hypothetical protein
VARALGLDVGSEKLSQLSFPFEVVGEGLPEAVGERRLRVGRARVEGEAGGLAGETFLGLGQAEPVADEVEQVGGILSVEDREGWIEAEGGGVDAQQAVGDGVKSTRPGEMAGGGARGELRPPQAQDELCPAGHLGRRPTGEGQEQHALWIRTAGDQLGHPVREGGRLARPGASDDEERPGAMLHGQPLSGIELVDVVSHHDPH